MEKHAKEPQQKRDIVVAVVGWVVFIIGFGESSLPRGVLDVAIPPNKVPVKVAHVHMIHLVIPEEVPVAVVLSIATYVLWITGIASGEEDLFLTIDRALRFVIVITG